MDIILYLLTYVNDKRKIIGQLLNFICRYIPLKQWAFDDSHSPKYQKLKIDILPKIISYQQDWTWKDLILYYQKRYGKTIKKKEPTAYNNHMIKSHSLLIPEIPVYLLSAFSVWLVDIPQDNLPRLHQPIDPLCPKNRPVPDKQNRYWRSIKSPNQVPLLSKEYFAPTLQSTDCHISPKYDDPCLSVHTVMCHSYSK